MLPEVLSVCAQLVTAVYDALKSSKAKVHFPGEEVQLTQGGACFSVIDSGIKVRHIIKDDFNNLYNKASGVRIIYLNWKRWSHVVIVL